MKLIENPWFVGIGTGIISGVLVFFLTKWIMDKKGRVEYYKQVNSANLNVINSLKPYIADKGLPNIDIFEALISSTARTFGVDKKDMYSVAIYCEELIREIISDVYVSNEKKQEYTTSLAKYKADINKASLVNVVNTTELSLKYSERFSRQISMYLAVLTSILGMVTSFLIVFKVDGINADKFWYPFEDNPANWIPFIFLLLIALILTMVLILDKLPKTLKWYRTILEQKKDVDLDESKK